MSNQNDSTPHKTGISGEQQDVGVVESQKRGRGRPALHTTADERKAANAAAAREYRARVKAMKAARRNPAQPLTSSIIDLSAVRQW